MQCSGVYRYMDILRQLHSDTPASQQSVDASEDAATSMAPADAASRRTQMTGALAATTPEELEVWELCPVCVVEYGYGI